MNRSIWAGEYPPFILRRGADAQKPVAKGIRYSVVKDTNVRYLCWFSVMAGTFVSIVTTARVR